MAAHKPRAWGLLAMLVGMPACSGLQDTVRTPPPSAPEVPCSNVVVVQEGKSGEPVWEHEDGPPPDNVARFIAGEFRLPRGWKHVCTRGRTSQTGYWQGPGGLRIDYDVGGTNTVLAQEGRLSPIDDIQTEDIDGVRLQYGYRGTQLVATLVMLRPANFAAAVADVGEAEQVLQILRGFRPTPCALRGCRASAQELNRIAAQQQRTMTALREDAP